MNKLILACLLLVVPLFSSEFYHTLESVNHGGKEVVLTDGTAFSIGWWYTGVTKDWVQGSRLRISNASYPLNSICLENEETGTSAWGNITLYPEKEKQVTLARKPNSQNDPDAWKKVVLSNGLIFTNDRYIPSGWQINDAILIFHDGDTYDLYNITRKNYFYYWRLTGNEKPEAAKKITFEDILSLEDRLNHRVVYQKSAVSSVFAQLLNYCAGVNNPAKPIGVFLFIGPTGVGKTELAKTLADELFHNPSHLLRFDMSHFVEPHSLTRLIGTPPGYVNHEEGGQLTEPLKKTPQAIVLLDEMEKANPIVQKVFLPVFDEGYIQDSKHHTISTKDAIFIMTSNLCSEQISEMYHQGYSDEEILDAIEPTLMKVLSPELYNRVETVLFHPLNPDAMVKLVDLMIDEIRNRIASEKQITLIVDDSARDYLINNGYHPTLGARPLKKLIDRKLVPALSMALIKEGLPTGVTLRISYSPEEDLWSILNEGSGD